MIPDKLERIDRSYNAEIKIKTTLKTVRETVGNSERSTSEMSRDYDNNVNRENDSDGSDGCDGSRGSANDINDNNPMVMTATNQEEISSNTIEKGQGTIPGAVTPVTAVTSRSLGIILSIHSLLFLLRQLFNKQVRNHAKCRRYLQVRC